METFAKKQELPPAGGYKPLHYERVPAKTLFKGRTLIAGFIGMTAGAWYLYYLTFKKVHFEEIEHRSAQIALVPFLLAERDRAHLKQLRRNRDEEAKLMANVPGWEVGKYYGEPIYHTLPEDHFVDQKYLEYYIHSSQREANKRLHFAFTV